MPERILPIKKKIAAFEYGKCIGVERRVVRFLNCWQNNKNMPVFNLEKENNILTFYITSYLLDVYNGTEHGGFTIIRK